MIDIVILVLAIIFYIGGLTKALQWVTIIAVDITKGNGVWFCPYEVPLSIFFDVLSANLA